MIVHAGSDIDYRDPLDSTKGIIPKLLAFEALLNKHPSWRGKVVLIQVCGKPHGLKSKEVMEDYKKINQQLNEYA
jgi:trehalose 6-phosphate synthase/phosphatase